MPPIIWTHTTPKLSKRALGSSVLDMRRHLGLGCAYIASNGGRKLKTSRYIARSDFSPRRVRRAAAGTMLGGGGYAVALHFGLEHVEAFPSGKSGRERECVLLFNKPRDLKDGPHGCWQPSCDVVDGMSLYYEARPSRVV